MNLKKFILRFSFFLLPVIVGILYMECRLAAIQNSYNLKRTYFENGLDKWEVLVLGSSHALNDVNPDFLSRKTFNLANSSQSLFYDTQLTLKYLDRMSSLRCVVVTISYFTFWTELSDTREDWRNYFYYRYWGISEKEYPWYDLKKCSYIMLYSPSTTLKYITGTYHDETQERMSVNGWYRKDLRSEAEDLSEEKGKTKVMADERTMDAIHFEKNVQMLKEFTGIMKKRNIEVVFLTTPLYSTYRKFMDENINRKNTEALLGLCKYYSCKWMDFSSDPRFTAGDFNDIEHLNYKGAEKFSRILDADLFGTKNLMPTDSMTSNQFP